ncbi:MAG: xanthine dehydrogenase family protein molybdopterin-binding subunit [Acidimicrobiia bacterium]|nr:xanthine dehydrogenase family protein molybdopterin-binding subunit [Acidimicrobiia bacterium]
MQFGTKVRRVEDADLVAGRGRFVDDIEPPGTLHAAIVRSPIANGAITGVDTSGLKPDVPLFTFEDVSHISWPHLIPELPVLAPLANGRVRYQGEAVAAVFGEDRWAAADARESVWVDYDQWEAAVDPIAAMEPDAPLVYEEMGSNVVLRSAVTPDEDVFAGADVVVEERINNHRMAPGMVETRAILAIPENDGLVVYCGHQMPFRLRDLLASGLGLEPDQVRVIVPDMGGGFGAKGGFVYPEYPLVAAAALRLGRPVKYIETRSENLATTCHARDHSTTIGVAATSRGDLVGLRIRTVGNLGAAAMNQRLCLGNTQAMAAGCYRIPKIDFEIKGVLTNTAPLGAFRGAGRPEAAYAIERIMDHLARRLDMDPAELRRRNFIPPDDFPHTTKVGAVYDSGRYEDTLDRALDRAGYSDIRREQQENPDRIIGVGLASYLEVTARGGEFGAVEMDGDGAVTVRTGSSPHGQGHKTTWAQLVADELGVPFESITVIASDTALVPRGWGTAGSRSAPLAGTAAQMAAGQVADRLRELAAERMEAAAADIVLENGVARVAGTDVSVPLGELAGEAGGLEAEVDFTPDGAGVFPFGTHVCVVEIHPDTGEIEILKYVSLDDIGTVINPIITEGQIIAGVSHGLTHALFEEVRFDESGSLLTGNWTTYRIPAISDAFDFDIARTETPTPLNPLGMKGVGEPGTTGATPAVANAVMDAMARFGITDADLPMPYTPHKVWAVLRSKV